LEHSFIKQIQILLRIHCIRPKLLGFLIKSSRKGYFTLKVYFFRKLSWEIGWEWLRFGRCAFFHIPGLVPILGSLVLGLPQFGLFGQEFFFPFWEKTRFAGIGIKSGDKHFIGGWGWGNLERGGFFGNIFTLLWGFPTPCFFLRRGRVEGFSPFKLSQRGLSAPFF